MIAHLAGLQQLVAFTFILTFFGMSAAALFLLIERHQVAESFRLSVTVAGVICAIAAGNYFFMRQIYIDGAISGDVAFPTEFRYIDWFLTVPLMLAQFPMHLGLGRKGAGFMTRLMVLSVLMLAFGYVGEVNPDHRPLQITMWLIGCGFAAAIFVPLALALRRLPEHVSRASARTVRAMAILTLIGWMVYPLGYLQPLLGFPPDIRELIYNIADVINKVGLGAIIFWGGYAALRSRDQHDSDQIDSDRRGSDRHGRSDAPRGRSATDSLIGRSATDTLLSGS
jgi:bacteriorhodopsin